MALALLPRADWASGLFQATPLLIPALAAPISLAETSTTTPFRPAAEELSVWLYRACLFFGLLVVINPLGPGMNWGSRFLLTVLPLLALLAARTLERDYRAGSRPRQAATLLCAALLAGVSLFSQYQGLQAILRDLAQSRRLVETAQRASSSILVSDLWWLGAEITPAPVSKTHFLVEDNEEDRRVFLAALDRLGAEQFSYFGSSQGLQRLRAAAEHRQPPFLLTESHAESGWRVARFQHSASGAPR